MENQEQATKPPTPKASEDQDARAESAAAALSGAEERAVACFAALQKAERDFKEGVQFGEAVIALRDEIKASGGRNFKKRLGELSITYAKARYWIAVAEGKEINRGKGGAGCEAFDWDAATARLEKLADSVFILKQSQPDASEGFVESLRALAENLGHDLIAKDGGCDA